MDVKKLREIYDEEWCERAREFVSYEQNSLYSWEWERMFFLFDVIRPFLFYWGCETWNCFDFFAAKQIYAKKQPKRVNFESEKFFFSFNLDVGKDTRRDDDWRVRIV